MPLLSELLAPEDQEQEHHRVLADLKKARQLSHIVTWSKLDLIEWKADRIKVFLGSGKSFSETDFLSTPHRLVVSRNSTERDLVKDVH